jgi:hypothetical protein
VERQGSCGITIVSLQRKTIFDIQLNPYWAKWQTKYSKLADKDFETSEFHQDMWNCYLMSGFVSAYFHGTLCQIFSYDGHKTHYAMT